MTMDPLTYDNVALFTMYAQHKFLLKRALSITKFRH